MPICKRFRRSYLIYFLISRHYQLLIICSQECRNYPSSYLTETNRYSIDRRLIFMGNCKVYKGEILYIVASLNKLYNILLTWQKNCVLILLRLRVWGLFCPWNQNNSLYIWKVSYVQYSNCRWSTDRFGRASKAFVPFWLPCPDCARRSRRHSNVWYRGLWFSHNGHPDAWYWRVWRGSTHSQLSQILHTNYRHFGDALAFGRWRIWLGHPETFWDPNPSRRCEEPCFSYSTFWERFLRQDAISLAGQRQSTPALRHGLQDTGYFPFVVKFVWPTCPDPCLMLYSLTSLAVVGSLYKPEAYSSESATLN